MASIIINSTILIPGDIENIYLQKANANYACDATAPSNYQKTEDNRDISGAGTVNTYTYSYSELAYAWEFSDKGSSTLSLGIHTFTSLN